MGENKLKSDIRRNLVMASFLIAGKGAGVLSELFMTEFYGAMGSLLIRDEDAVVNVAELYGPTLEAPGIIITGYSGLELLPDQDLFFRIHMATHLPIFMVPSVCNTVGVARAGAPYLEVFVNPSNARRVAERLKEAKVSWGVEFHCIGSNFISKKNKDGLYVRVNLLQNEARLSERIIQHLKELGLTRDQIVVNILHKFVSAKGMKQ